MTQASGAEADAAALRYHALFDAVPDPVSILDADGIVLDLKHPDGLGAMKLGNR